VVLLGALSASHSFMGVGSVWELSHLVSNGESQRSSFGFHLKSIVEVRYDSYKRLKGMYISFFFFFFFSYNYHIGLVNCVGC
jgi:hypothetical protein